MNQIPNIEETQSTKDEKLRREFTSWHTAETTFAYGVPTNMNIADWWLEKLHHQLQKAREEALEREKQLKQVHMMELDAISCMSLEQYVAWRDYRKQRPHYSELDQDELERGLVDKG